MNKRSCSAGSSLNSRSKTGISFVGETAFCISRSLSLRPFRFNSVTIGNSSSSSKSRLRTLTNSERRASVRSRSHDRLNDVDGPSMEVEIPLHVANQVEATDNFRYVALTTGYSNRYQLVRFTYTTDLQNRLDGPAVGRIPELHAPGKPHEQRIRHTNLIVLHIRN